MSGSKFHGLLIVALLFAGGVLLVYGVGDTARAWRCSYWPVVKGRIMDSGISEIDEGVGNGVEARFVPDIKYEYKFKGESHFNNAIGYLPPSVIGLSDSYYASDEDSALRFAAHYSVNSHRDVYVNPVNPAEAVLDPSIKLPIFIPMILGALCVYTAFHMWFFHRDGCLEEEIGGINNTQGAV